MEELITEQKNISGMDNFEDKLRRNCEYPLKASKVDILQLNVTRKCNLTCKHCHVRAGPGRKEIMPRDIISKCVKIAEEHNEIATIDITGGAPETNPDLEWLLNKLSVTKKRLIVRSNLVILLEPAYQHFIEVYKDNRVELAASLPDWKKDRTDRQRGQDIFDKSIQVLRNLNKKGYADTESGLILNLVHNPAGAYLPGAQKELEMEYRKQLKTEYGVNFNNLYCITNMPIGRYLDYLKTSGNLDEYMSDLVMQYNPSALSNLMCKVMLSVGWDGTLYDCDFNQMLGFSLVNNKINNINYFDFNALRSRDIFIHNHCYGCTAGMGSSCQGSFNGK